MVFNVEEDSWTWVVASPWRLAPRDERRSQKKGNIFSHCNLKHQTDDWLCTLGNLTLFFKPSIVFVKNLKQTVLLEQNQKQSKTTTIKHWNGSFIYFFSQFHFLLLSSQLQAVRLEVVWREWSCRPQKSPSCQNLCLGDISVGTGQVAWNPSFWKLSAPLWRPPQVAWNPSFLQRMASSFYAWVRGDGSNRTDERKISHSQDSATSLDESKFDNDLEVKVLPYIGFWTGCFQKLL